MLELFSVNISTFPIICWEAQDNKFENKMWLIFLCDGTGGWVFVRAIIVCLCQINSLGCYHMLYYCSLHTWQRWCFFILLDGQYPQLMLCSWWLRNISGHCSLLSCCRGTAQEEHCPRSADTRERYQASLLYYYQWTNLESWSGVIWKICKT